MEVLIFVHHFLSEDSNFAPSDWILWSLVSFPSFWQVDDLSPKYLTCCSLRTEMTPISTTRYCRWKSNINNVKQQKLLVQLLFFLSLMRKVKYPSFALGIYFCKPFPSRYMPRIFTVATLISTVMLFASLPFIFLFTEIINFIF